MVKNLLTGEEKPKKEKDDTVVVLAEKITNRMALHMFAQRGGTLALGELFGVRILNTESHNFVSVQVISKGIDAKVKYSVNPTHKLSKAPPKKKGGLSDAMIKSFSKGEEELL